MATLSRTAVVCSDCAMAGRAVATTVESSYCMKSAHPTMKGVSRAARAASGDGGGEEAGATESADMWTGDRGSSRLYRPVAGRAEVNWGNLQPVFIRC